MLINDNYEKIKSDYLFTQIRKNVAEFERTHPSERVIDLSIGDVKLPPPKEVVKEMKRAVAEMGTREKFRGYSEEGGCPFLREAISREYQKTGADVSPEEIFINDGAKPAIGDVLELLCAKTALIITPCYPLYKDISAAFGMRVVYSLGTPENSFAPYPDPAVKPDVIFLCSPDNPTGTAFGRDIIRAYVDYAAACGALVVFDGAYNAFLGDDDPKSVFLFSGAERCAVEIASYSKNLSFTGIRCGYTAIKKQSPLYELYKKRESIRTNGVCYIAQRGAAASYRENARKQTSAAINYYRENARIISRPIIAAGLRCFGGEKSPYLFFQCGKNGEDFSRELLEKAHVAATPGEGFCAPGYARFSCFCTRKDAYAARSKLAEFFRVRG